MTLNLTVEACKRIWERQVRTHRYQKSRYNVWFGAYDRGLGNEVSGTHRKKQKPVDRLGVLADWR